MKALSIRAPWPWAIFNGKDIENRTWPTHYTGSFLIHTGKTFDHYGYGWILKHRFLFKSEVPHKDDFELGGLVGISYIIDCVSDHESPFFFGPWGFILRDSRPIEFIPYKGKLNFFNVNIDLNKIRILKK